MFKINHNLWLTIIKSIVVTVNIGLMPIGLVSCSLNPSPPVIEKPTFKSDPSPSETDEDDDQQDEDNEENQDTEQQNKS